VNVLGVAIINFNGIKAEDAYQSRPTHVNLKGIWLPRRDVYTTENDGVKKQKRRSEHQSDIDFPKICYASDYHPHRVTKIGRKGYRIKKERNLISLFSVFSQNCKLRDLIR
jgi:hypothetical protein